MKNIKYMLLMLLQAFGLYACTYVLVTKGWDNLNTLWFFINLLFTIHWFLLFHETSEDV